VQLVVQMVLTVYVKLGLYTGTLLASFLMHKIQSTLALQTPTIADTRLLWTENTPLSETKKKCKDATPSITDSRYYRTVNISCGPKLIFLLFFSCYKGQFGCTCSERHNCCSLGIFASLYTILTCISYDDVSK